jgi:hypothetical protein
MSPVAMPDDAELTEDRTMRRLWGVALPLASLALLVVGCAGHSLVPREQAAALKTHERTLAPHASAIHEAIRRSGHLGALAFLDAGDGRLIVLPGDTPTDAWARHRASAPEGSPAARVSMPPVLTFVYRADVPKAPEAVPQALFQEREALVRERQALAASLAALETRHRELAESVAAAREDTQKALKLLGDDLAAARTFMLQTAQLAWLNQEQSAENANSLRKTAKASEQLVSTSARLADSMRQLSESLAAQLKELASRLDTIQSKVSDIK